MEDVAWVRRGEITEIVGRPSSGRTSLFTACLRDVTRREAVAALVDAEQAFDPASAARAGVDLRRLLWVRCGGRRDRAGCDRLGRPGPGAHAPRGGTHSHAGAARAPATRVVAVLLVERVSRFACLWIDAFVAAAAERSEPALRAEPLAVVAPAPT